MRRLWLELAALAVVTPDVELLIQVEEGRVHEVRFDGAGLVALPTRDDSVVTLDDIYEAVTGRPKPAP